MIFCILKHMLLICAKGIAEFLQILLAMAIVIGIPAFVIWGVGELIKRYWGEKTLDMVILISMLSFLVFIVVKGIWELYQRARRECG